MYVLIHSHTELWKRDGLLVLFLNYNISTESLSMAFSKYVRPLTPLKGVHLSTIVLFVRFYTSHIYIYIYIYFYFLFF